MGHRAARAGQTIGLGIPGLFDPADGRVLLFPNLPGPWAGYPLRARLEQELGRGVQMINDARAFTLAEGTLGAGAGCGTLVCVTLGTGIGGGVMIDGKLHLGAFGVAGEIAHQTVLPDGPLCGCGNHGCVEALARSDVLADGGGQGDGGGGLCRRGRGRRAVYRRRFAFAAGWLGIALANVVAVARAGADRRRWRDRRRGRTGARSDQGRRPSAGDPGTHRPDRCGGRFARLGAGAIGAALVGMQSDPA